VSVDIPKVTVVFGSVTPPQEDVIELKVHSGCTKEVSSFECLLQNWDKKYSPNGTSPINVGMDGSISVGRGSNVPQLITCRVESVKFESSHAEHYLRVSGRCWGERLFRCVVTKTYENKKGEEIVKDLIDYYVGLNHVRDSTELIENTDTTFTRLEYENTPVIDVLQFVAESSDKACIIGYDFRVAADGKFEFFPRDSKASSVNLAEKLESSEYVKDIHRIRNRITIYGAADKSVPVDKDVWTESLTPTDGAWSSVGGTVSFDTSFKVRGSGSIKETDSNAYYGGVIFTLNAGKEVDANLFPILSFWLYLESAFNGNVTVYLIDTSERQVYQTIAFGKGKWSYKQVKVGVVNAESWESIDSGFDWTSIKKVRFDCWFDGVGSGSFWVDGLYFGGKRYSSMQEDVASQASYGLRELVDTDEELYSDNECACRARALLAFLKDPAESLTVRSTVVDYAGVPLVAGDKVHVALPNEDVDADFRVLSVEYHVNGKEQTLELCLELGREQPFLADYLFALRSKTGHLSRHKVARLM